MASEVGSTVPDDMAGGAPPKAAILLVLGEPFSEDDKNLIIAELTKGFRAWDYEATGIDINDELSQIANRAALGDEGPNGERLIRHRSENVAVEILVNPQAVSVKKSLRGILTQLSPHKVVFFSGYAIQGQAAWVVQDDIFSFSNFAQLFKDPDVENALKQVEGATLDIHTVGPNDWTNALKGSDPARMLKVSVNPPDKMHNIHGVLQLSAYLSSFLKPVPLSNILQSSDVIGNISFTRPVLYIFPACQGDSALFGMKGFNMLVNGGYSHRSCFWDFARHLDGIDAMLLTHLGPDNLFGLKALLERKNAETIHPDIGYMFMNHGKHVNTNGDAGEGKNGDSLLINLAAEGNKILELSKHLSHTPHPLSRPASGNLEPINLFHKVGMGSLDMYVLNPVGDSKEMKDFLQQWGKQSSSFGSSSGIPIPSLTSICALLVVRPASPNEKVTRILFPGNAPQHKLLEGLERVKNLEFLKHPTFCTHDLQKPKKATGAGNGRAGSASRKPPPVTKAAAAPTRAEPPKRLETKPAATKATSTSAASAKTTKLKKEDNNKRASSAKDKEKVKLDEKEKEDKSKSSTSSSPSKASVKTASPVKTPSSPVKTPATATPDEAPAVVPELLQSQTNHVDEVPAANFLSQEPLVPTDDNRVADSPEALPEPAQFGTDVDSFAQQQPADQAMTDKQKLQEMGIYDDDEEEEGVDNDYDNENENGFMRAGGSPDAEDELVQPQPLPEPVAAIETPSSAGPDLIQDTFDKFPAREEQAPVEDSQAPVADEPAVGPAFEPSTQLPVETAVEPEPVVEQSAQEPEEPEFEPEPAVQQSSQASVETAFEPEPAIQQSSQAPVETAFELEPAVEQPEESRFEPEPAEPEFPSQSGPDAAEDPAEDIPLSPEPKAEERPDFGFSDEVNEPSFTEEPQMSSDSSAFEQSIQYGITSDNGYQMGGIREEEEEEAAGEVGGDERPEEGQGDGHPTGKPDLDKFSMEELGIYDEEEQEGEEEAAAGDGGDDDNEAYVYEKDVNLEDEEVHRGGPTESEEQNIEEDEEEEEEQQFDQGEGREEEDEGRGFEADEGAQEDTEQQEVSNIPEAFEKDETPTPIDKQAEEPAAEDLMEEPVTAEADSGREDTDSIDGGMPEDDEKDIDEVAVQQQQEQMQSDLMEQEEEEQEMDEQTPAYDEGCTGRQGFNPFIGLDEQNAATAQSDPFQQNPFDADELESTFPQGRQGLDEFDPQAQWGHPTGLPSPAPPQDDDAEAEEQSWKAGPAAEEEYEQHIDAEKEGAEHKQHLDADKEEEELKEFDPATEWGQPMGLPSPPPPEADTKAASKNAAGDSKKAEPKKTSPTKPKTSDKRPTSATKASPKPANGSSESPRTARTAVEKKAESKTKASLDTSRSARPATAPVRSLDTSKVESKSRTTTTAAPRRPATATGNNRASPVVTKMPPLPPMTPFYVDLTYIPAHGDSAYSDIEFFKRVRARYYVLSALAPNPTVLQALMEAKGTWEKGGEQEVTIIPTYETDVLRHWMALHKDQLAQLKIDIAPAASRCTVRLQDHEDSCFTYRLEF